MSGLGGAFDRKLDELLAEAEFEVRAFVRDYEADRWALIWGEDAGKELTGLRTLIDDHGDPRPWRATP